MDRLLTEDGTRWISDDTAVVDLLFQDSPGVVAAYLLKTPAGLALVECGPSTTIDALLTGIEALGEDARDIQHVLVTHIHLDHAGAAGGLLRRFPHARVYCHEFGAPHMIDPSRLVGSAARIYGDRMETLWGEFVPVAADRLSPLRDGDTLDLDGRALDVLHTPGHASHHVTFVDAERGIMFTGDAAGIRILPSTIALPPTPPPDIDIEAWHDSVAAMRMRSPRQLLLTHFGVVDSVDAHFTQLDQQLDEWTDLVARLSRQGLDRDAIVDRLARHVRGLMDAANSGDAEPKVALNTPYGMAVDGLLRYLRKRNESRPL